MDKVRAFLNVAWQQRFWVLSALGVLIALVCWKLAAGQLDAEFSANRSTIDTRFTEMNTISSKKVHGNPSVNERDRQEAVKIRDQVLQLWKSLYDRQKEQVLKWPASLEDEFLENVQDRKFGDPIAPSGQKLIAMLETYRNYAKDRFPALVEIVQAKKMTDGTSAFGGGGRDGGVGRPGAEMFDANGLPIEEDYLVEWADQGLLRAQLEFPQRPTSLQVWVTQEDLWVYETLLHAIAKTNEAAGASRPDNAAIRWILALEVGQKAAMASREPGLIMVPVSPAGGGEGDMGRGGVGAPEGMYPADGAAAVDPGQLMLAGRYIGADGQPIAEATGDFSGEFRRLPVRMLLMMDQQALPTVLIECANAALPIEVQRVRINKEKSGAGFDASMAAPSVSMGGGDGGGVGRPGGYGDSGGVGRPSGYGGGDGGRGGGGYGGYMPSAPVGGPATSGLATIEIHGIVYIYNPPDPTSLAVPGVEEGGADETIAATDAATAAL